MENYINLWMEYFKVFDKLNEKERVLFCKFMEEASKPRITSDELNDLRNRFKEDYSFK